MPETQARAEDLYVELLERVRTGTALEDSNLIISVGAASRNSLRAAPIAQLAVLGLDGDMYSSTIQAIEALYPKLSPGGYCIVDDHGAVEGCRQAISDYRAEHGIVEPMEQIDWTGVFWRKR